MKIIEIDSEQTNDKQVAYVTDEPITAAVFQRFVAGIRLDPSITTKFDLENGLLIVHRLDLDRSEVDQVENLLTQAKESIERKHNEAKKAHEELLQSLSRQTGRPIRKKPPVSETGASAGDAEKK